MAKTKWNYIIPFIVIIALNLCCLKIYGFEVSTTDSGKEIKWKKDNVDDLITVTYLINTTNEPSGSLEALLAAMQTWTDVDTSTFTFVDGGTTSINSHGEADGINIIDFGVIEDEGVLGQNSFWFYLSGEMIDSDIRFNTKNEWSTDASSDKFDVQNVGTHELGHSLSLADLYSDSDSEKTMYGYGTPGDTSQRTLHQDDMDGIAYLYPANTSSPNPTPVVTPTPGVTTGALAGFVTDDDRGLVIAGATVRNQSGLLTATTGVDGFYSIADVQAGNRTFIASAPGYTTSAPASIVVTAGETTNLDFALVASVLTSPVPTVTPTPVTATLVVAVAGEDGSIAGATVTVDGQSGVTDASGGAAFTLEAGDYTVSVSATDYLTSVSTVTVMPPVTIHEVTLEKKVCPEPDAPVASNATVTPDSLSLAKGDSEDVIVLVIDDNGCPAQGVKVKRKLSSANKKMINVKPLSAKTDASGLATFTIRAKKDKGKANVKFSVGGVKDKPKVKIALTK